MDPYRISLTPYFGRRCSISGAFTYEEELYFYAFDAVVAKALAKAALEDAVGSWKALAGSRVKVDPANLQVFGATVNADNDPEPDEAVSKAIKKHGLKGLVQVGLSTPGPLFYDRSTGQAFFFPDGTAMTLGAGGKKPRVVSDLDIKIVTAKSKVRQSIGARLEAANNAVIDLLDAGADPKKIVGAIDKGLAGMTIERIRTSKFDSPEHFGWLLMKKGELLEKLGLPKEAAVAYAAAVHAGQDEAAAPLGRLKKKR